MTALLKMEDMTNKEISEELRVLFHGHNESEINSILIEHHKQHNPIDIVQLILELTKELVNRKQE